METKKFMEINGVHLYMIIHDDTNWVPIRPICNAIQINYKSELLRLKYNEVIGWSIAVLKVKLRDRDYFMNCIPQRFFYGWIFGIKNNNKAIREFKMKCYDLLFEGFFEAEIVLPGNIS